MKTKLFVKIVFLCTLGINCLIEWKKEPGRKCKAAVLQNMFEHFLKYELKKQGLSYFSRNVDKKFFRSQTFQLQSSFFSIKHTPNKNCPRETGTKFMTVFWHATQISLLNNESKVFSTFLHFFPDKVKNKVSSIKAVNKWTRTSTV